MRVAALADIHGNVHALDAVLADPRFARAELVVVLGDVIAGPFPAETFDRLADLGPRVRVLRGNADRLVFDEGTEVSRWRRERLGAERLSAARTWPSTFVVDVDTLGAVRCCHATPTSDEAFLTRLTPDEDFIAELAGTAERMVIGGHTHVQFDRTVGVYRFVNVGSVGWPYEGRPGAYWALLGPDVELVQTQYDVAAAAAAIRASGHPGAEDALGALLDPLSSDEGSRRYETLRGT
jgi:predicted phosphodiesterase